MQWMKIGDSWNRFVQDASRNWTRLSAYELAVTAGRRDLLLRRLQEAYDLSYDDADQQIESWQLSLGGSRC